VSVDLVTSFLMLLEFLKFFAQGLYELGTYVQVGLRRLWGGVLTPPARPEQPSTQPVLSQPAASGSGSDTPPDLPGGTPPPTPRPVTGGEAPVVSTAAAGEAPVVSTATAGGAPVVSTAAAVSTAEPVSFTTVEACIGLGFVFLSGFVIFLLPFLGVGPSRSISSADVPLSSQPIDPLPEGRDRDRRNKALAGARQSFTASGGAAEGSQVRQSGAPQQRGGRGRSKPPLSWYQEKAYQEAV
jgi:hypothetical protein